MDSFCPLLVGVEGLTADADNDDDDDAAAALRLRLEGESCLGGRPAP
jgi:hypothetical protein